MNMSLGVIPDAFYSNGRALIKHRTY